MTYSRRDFTKAASGLFVRADPRPNIVVIIADDLGYGDLGCYGGKIETPNIDRLAREGIRLTNYHSGASVCSPSRAALLTGCYSNRTGIDTVISPDSDKGISSDNYTMADILRYNGYHTGCVGKWHVGHKQREQMPLGRGFNTFWGIPYSSDMYPLPEIINEEVGEELYHKRELLTLRCAEKAVNFVKRAPETSPYFLYLAFTSMHLPLLPSPDFNGISGKGKYADVLFELDFAVGQVVKTIKERDEEQGTDTLILFTSDNGADMDITLKETEKGSNYPCSGGKFGLSEGGTRVPFIAYLPKIILESRTSNELLTTMDLKPTLGAGVALSDKWHVGTTDGVNVWPLLKGEVESVNRGNPILVIQEGFLSCALRKYEFEDGTYRTMKIYFPGKDTRDPSRLYDLSVDLGERNNVAPYNQEVTTRMLQESKEVLATFAPGVVQSSIS